MAVDRTRLPTPGPDPIFSFPEARKRALLNDLGVWTVEHHDVPVVTALLLMSVGSASDPTSRPGLAALTGALLDEGSGNRTGLDMHEALGGIGAQFDADVSADATVLRITTLERFADQALALLAEMAARPRFDPDQFERVRVLRLDRLLQLKDVAAAVADRTFTHVLYGEHPYGHLPIGTETALRAVTRDEVVAFHGRCYQPSAATLILVGDATHDALLELATNAFGAWSASQPSVASPARTESDWQKSAPASGDKLVVVDRRGSAQSELRIGHVSAARNTADHHALIVLNMALGGQFASRVNLNLRQDKGFTYGARTAFDFRRDPGPFVAQLSVQTSATAASIREVIHEISSIRDERPITEPELDLAKAALTRGFPRSFETADRVARGLAQVALYRLDDDYFTRFVPQVAAVDCQAVTRVAQAYLAPERLSTVIVGDREAIASSVSELQLGTQRDIRVTDEPD